MTREINWGAAVLLIDSKNRKVIEAPVNYPNGMVYSVKSSAPLPNSIRTSLVLVRQDKGNFTPYFLKITHENPDHIFNASNFHEIGYLNIPADFSGTFHIHNWDESFIGGIVYKDGKISRNIIPKKN